MKVIVTRLQNLGFSLETAGSRSECSSWTVGTAEQRSTGQCRRVVCGSRMRVGGDAEGRGHVSERRALSGTLGPS